MCSVYSLMFVTACIGVGITCIIRTICLWSITFVEESIGESSLRVIFFCITGITGVIVVAVQVTKLNLFFTQLTTL